MRWSKRQFQSTEPPQIIILIIQEPTPTHWSGRTLKQILLMKDGSLVHHGTSQQLLAAAPTQVWTCTVPRAQADQLLHQYPVVNLKTLPQGVQLRVLSQTPPTPEAHPAEMTLEDLFLHYFGETAGETDAAL